MYPRALTIAGSDSGGGAGIQADLKTFHNLGVFGMSAITALTAQNTLGIQGILGVSPEFLELEIRSVLTDIGTDAVKTGMLLNSALTRCTARLLKEFNLERIVVDPVMVAKDGSRLLEEDTIDVLRNELIPLAAIITPNLDEAGVLVKRAIHNHEEMRDAAKEIAALGAKSVLVKGGHLKGASAVDIFFDGKKCEQLESPYIRTQNTHGTGCALSAAIAAYLALGKSTRDAVRLAKNYVTEALRHARPLGHGISPVNHLFPFSTSHNGSET